MNENQWVDVKATKKNKKQEKVENFKPSIRLAGKTFRSTKAQ